ncbi:probable arginine--tRNA ligase, mitochondrial [Parasteatoda tepidariorum]|uniref:probable arginine--tRNA ligase, mitochondrial n=1 Tax=Parasteatoda tepidariorum TaxID=114398 RepID=UPI001C71A23C|nr:probable arginine--tRNA ligase, mitochondrial [Parasteatoda tepidariorum]
MASFFRQQIARKVLPFLRNNEGSSSVTPNLISSFIKVNRRSKNNPELLMSWQKIVHYSPEVEDWLTLPKLVNLLRNQGLPTAEGVIDIGLSESPLGLTFTVDKHVYSKIVLTDICENEEFLAVDNSFFHNTPLKKIAVHFSLPSVGERFNMSDFRTIIHCNFIENISTFFGNQVNKIYSMADWNLKSAITLTGFKKLGDEKELLNNPASHLFEVSKIAKQLYESDPSFQNEVNSCFKDEDKCSEWFNIRNLCWEQYTPVFEKLDLSFDNVRFDSSFSSEVKKVYEDLVAKNLIIPQHDGTLKANFMNNHKEDAASNSQISKFFIYSLCNAIHSAIHTEATYNFDILYYVAPKSQENFFEVFSSLLTELNYSWSEKLCFIGVENISDFHGRKKRASVEDILNEMNLFMLKKLETELYLETNESLERVAEILSYSSLLMFDMKHRRNFNYSLNLNEILSFGRNSGAAFQLCHAGLKGLFEDNEILFKVDIDTSPLLEPEAQNLILHLSRFDEMVYKSYSTLEPFFLCQYLSSLWYYTDRAASVLKLDLKSDRLIVIKARLLLFSATLNILQKCLEILGVKPYVNKYSQPRFV